MLKNIATCRYMYTLHNFTIKVTSVITSGGQCTCSVVTEFIHDGISKIMTCRHYDHVEKMMPAFNTEN